MNKDFSDTNFITGLRAVAILLVYVIHSGGLPIVSSFNFYENIINFGKYGVQLFFVISGFTIYYQLFKQNYKFKDFLLIRILRISIVYFPILFMMVVYNNFISSESNYWLNKFTVDGVITIKNILLHIFYVGYIDSEFANTIIGVEWTLNVEIFYYIIFGIFIYLGIIKNNLINNLSGIFMFMLIMIFFVIIAEDNIIDKLIIEWLPFYYGYMFMLGGFSFYIRYHYKFFTNYKLSNLSIIVFFIINILAIIYFTKLHDQVIGLMVSVSCCILICFVNDNSSLAKLFANRLFIFIGTISYSFYLLHIIVIKFFNVYFKLGQNFKFFASLVVTIFISYIFYVFFESAIYKKLKKSIKMKKNV